MIYASEALSLSPGNESCLADLLKALSDTPEGVLGYSPLVSGGGVCRYRLARAEIELGHLSGGSVLWLLNEFDQGDSASAADAGCWLSILFPEKGLQYLERAVDLMPDEQFYRCLLVEQLVRGNFTERALEEFEPLRNSELKDVGYWQAAASVYEATGDNVGAIEASRQAYSMRRVPSTGADLGWRLYFHGVRLVRENRMSDAVPFLTQCSDVWSSDSSWALRADSLLDLMNVFTSISDGYEEPL
jgi:tetratricopeptide (TPR) repeat protein